MGAGFAFALAALSVGLSLATPTAGAQAPPDLAGTMTMTAAGPAWAPLVVPRTTRVTVFDGVDLPTRMDVEGPGRLRVAYLVKEPVSAASPGLIATSGEMSTGVLTPAGDLKLETDTKTAWVTLPAGRYRFYAGAGGGPVSAHVTIAGLGGSASLVPAEHVSGTVTSLDRRDGLPAGNLATWSRTHELFSPGVVAWTIASSAPATAAHRVELCVYGPDSDPDAPTAFQPNCPYATGGVSLAVPLAGEFKFGAALAAGPGPWGLGGNVQAAGPVTASESAGVWLETRGTPVGPTQPSVAPPVAPGGAGSPHGKNGSPRPALAIESLRVSRRGHVTARLACRAPIPCRGTVRATAGRRNLARRTWAAPAGSEVSVAFRVRLKGARVVTVRADANGGMRAVRRVRVGR